MSDQAVLSHHRFINSGKNVSLHIKNLCSDTIQKKKPFCVLTCTKIKCVFKVAFVSLSLYFLHSRHFIGEEK